jgi:hypothetical protein
MRIAYFGHINGGRRSGVFQKIAGQTERWQAGGNTVRVFVATRDDPDEWRARFEGALVRRYDGPLSRLRAMLALVDGVRGFRPDVVYLRWDLFYPPMLAFPRRAPLVIEINTDDLLEYALGTRIRALYNARTRALVMRRARAFVFVTDELSRRDSFRHFPGVHSVISNGIDLSAYPILPPPVNDRPRLVFVGSAGQPWHGIDKVEVLAGLRPGWDIDVVGMMADDSASPSNVVWHGPLDRTGVLDVLGRADVGIGSLAMHRVGISEACPLKVREYLAVGLPVVYGYSDSDADGLGATALSIANTESNVVDEIDRIDAFVERSRGTRIDRSSIAHIDTSAKERERLELFGELLDG